MNDVGLKTDTGIVMVVTMSLLLGSWDRSYLWSCGDAERGKSQEVGGMTSIPRFRRIMATVTRKRLYTHIRGWFERLSFVAAAGGTITSIN
jgi:hypothetical protein